MEKKTRSNLRVDYIQENNIQELTCSKTGRVLSLDEFRQHKGYYLSYCREWEREDLRKRAFEKKLVKINVEHNNESVLVVGKKTNSKGYKKVTSPYSDLKLYFDPSVDDSLIKLAYSEHTNENRNIIIE